MNRHAIAVLIAAQDASQDAPSPPTPAVRLALSWLTMAKVAEGWQVESFWTALTKAPEVPDRPQANYNRTRDMQIYIDAWKRAAGISLG